MSAGKEKATEQNVKEGSFRMQCYLFLMVRLYSCITNNVDSSKNYISMSYDQKKLKPSLFVTNCQLKMSPCILFSMFFLSQFSSFSLIAKIEKSCHHVSDKYWAKNLTVFVTNCITGYFHFCSVESVKHSNKGFLM